MLFIAISKTYRMYGLYNYILFLVQEAKELAEIQDIKHSFMVCSSLRRSFTDRTSSSYVASIPGPTEWPGILCTRMRQIIICQYYTLNFIYKL